MSVSGHRERDRYDELHPAYLLWCDEDRRQLYGPSTLLGPRYTVGDFRLRMVPT
ncbi:MAG: hypothetical protein ACYC10_16340 [Allorhizobium sp.]